MAAKTCAVVMVPNRTMDTSSAFVLGEMFRLIVLYSSAGITSCPCLSFIIAGCSAPAAEPDAESGASIFSQFFPPRPLTS